jgi:sn-glycerol 3-phosphate transport system permease protein
MSTDARAGAGAGTEAVAEAVGEGEVGDGPPQAPSRWRSRLGDVAWYALLGLLAVIVLFPIYMLVIRAISTPLSYIAAGQPLHPVDVEWDVFGRAWDGAGLGRAMAISATVTVIIVAVQFLTSVLAAYAFAFLEFPLKRLMFAVVIGTLLLPIEVTLIANVRTIRDLGWLNSVQGLSVPFLATAFGIFLIRQGFLGLPRDLRDAATLDGFGHLAFLFKVAVPLARPVIGSFLVISFLGAWNQYVWPRNATDANDWQTVQVALRTLTNERPDQLNLAFAGAILAALPLVVMLVLFQRQMVRGLTAGAVKG